MTEEHDPNRVVVSDDRMEITISSPEGQRATLRSARPDGFSDMEIDKARTFDNLQKRLEKLERQVEMLSHHGHAYAASYGPGGQWDRTTGPVEAKDAS